MVGLGAGRPADGILVAAGSGTRLGADAPKALVSLGGRPLFTHSLEAMLDAGSIASVFVLAPASHLDDVREMAMQAAGAACARVTVAAGGESRSESVRNGLGLTESDLVLVHDAARPFAPTGLFDRVLGDLAAATEATGAVIAAAPVPDTIKQVEAVTSTGGGHLVTRTLDRSNLRAAQTPQAFRSEALSGALASAGDLALATDDAMLIEGTGLDVAVAESSAWNFKITTRADLEAAEHLLRAQLH